MSVKTKQTCYEGDTVQKFQSYLKHSGEHEAVFQCVKHILPSQFDRYGKELLGLASGGFFSS